MKKFLILLLVFASTILLSSSIFATTTEFTAEVSFAGLGSVEFDVALKNVGTNSPATKITWDPTGINFGNTGTENLQWKAANVYAEMTKNITSSQGVVYIYQNNKSSEGNAAYVAVDPRFEVKIDDDGNAVYTAPGSTVPVTLERYNGLVKGSSKGGQFAYLPMTFKTSTVTVSSPDTFIVPPSAGPEAFWGTRYLSDMSDEEWVKGDYHTVANAEGFSADIAEEGGVKFLSPIEGSASVSTGYMYFSAGFHDVYGGNTFGSNHIIFEVLSE